MAVPTAPLFSLLHRLIPVIILSSKIPVTGRICKESVKVRTPKSPPTTDNAAFYLSTVNVFAYCTCTYTQDFCCFAQCEQTVSNRRRVSL